MDIMKKRECFKWIALILGLGAVCILVYKNYNHKGFYTASLVDILMLLVAVVLTFFYVERKNDLYRRNSCVEHVIMEIHQMAMSDQLIILDEDRTALMMQQTCGNKIKYLKDADFKEFKDDISFIENEFAEVRTIFSDHMANPEELGIVKKDLKRHMQNISDRCDKVRIKIYE